MKSKKSANTYTIFTILFLFILFSQPLAYADIIVLSNGDTLKGTITQLSGDKLAVDTEYGKGLTIDWGKVLSIETQEIIFIELKDEQTVRSKIKTNLEGWFLEDESGQLIALAKEEIHSFSLKKPKYWILEYYLSYQQETGNISSDYFRTRLNVKKKKRKYDLVFETSYAYGETEEKVSAHRLDFLFKYDHLMTKKIYRRGFFFLGRDRVRGIDRRFQAGPAIGYRFYDEETLSLSSDVGTIWEETKYENRNYESELKGLWNIDFSYVPFPEIPEIRVEGTLLWIQKFDEATDYEITSEASLSVPLMGGFFLKAGAIDRYDNKPEPGMKRNDTTLLVALSYRTKF
jgi:putative salt-induced outer membrane protein YdiY